MAVGLVPDAGDDVVEAMQPRRRAPECGRECSAGSEEVGRRTRVGRAGERGSRAVRQLSKAVRSRLAVLGVEAELAVARLVAVHQDAGAASHDARREVDAQLPLGRSITRSGPVSLVTVANASP